jgi:ABC-2 type transport system permease protein
MLAFARVALIRLGRDRTNLFFLLVFPLLLVLLLGASFGGGGPAPQVGLVGGDAALVATLGEQDLLVDEYADEATAAADVERGVVVAAVVVERGGARWLVPPEGVDVGLDVRVQRALSASAVRARAAAALTSLGVPGPGAVAAVDAVGDVGPSVTVTTVGDGGLASEFAGLGQFDLGASQQLLLFVFITALTSSVSVVQARRWRVVDRALTGPTSAGTVLGGLALGQLAIALVQAGLVLAGTALLFGVSWGDPVATGSVVVLFSVVATSAGMLLGALVSNEEQVAGIAVPLSLVAAAFGGSMLPLELFPEALLPLADATPHGWANRAFAEIVRRGGGVTDVLPELAVLGGFAVVLAVLATFALRRTTAAG